MGSRRNGVKKRRVITYKLSQSPRAVQLVPSKLAQRNGRRLERNPRRNHDSKPRKDRREHTLDWQREIDRKGVLGAFEEEHSDGV